MYSISSQYKKALVDYYKLNPSKNGVGIDEKEKLANKHQGWNDVLDQASKVRGSRVKKL